MSGIIGSIINASIAIFNRITAKQTPIKTQHQLEYYDEMNKLMHEFFGSWMNEERLARLKHLNEECDKWFDSDICRDVSFIYEKAKLHHFDNLTLQNQKLTQDKRNEMVNWQDERFVAIEDMWKNDLSKRMKNIIRNKG